MTTHRSLLDAWDVAAEVLEGDSNRPIRYGKCYRYLRDLDLNSKLLEVGCGEGTGLAIADHLGFKRLTGVEVSAERLRRAKRKLLGHANLISISPENRLPFRDQSFDIVVSAAVIEHTIDPAGFVREIARVIRPGGYVVISSDCWQWRILQLLGVYTSDQPIDKAIFPTSLFKMFEDCHLQLRHYEGFPFPGSEYIFFQLIERSIEAKRGIRPLIDLVRLFKRIVMKLARMLRLHTPTPIMKDARTKLDFTETVKKVVQEPLTGGSGARSFLTLLCSDENVFFLVKQKLT